MKNVDPKPSNIQRDVASISGFNDEQVANLKRIKSALNQADSCASWIEHSVMSDWLMTWRDDTETLFRSHIALQEVGR